MIRSHTSTTRRQLHRGAQRGSLAAKVIVLVAEPLGLAATGFDPDGDTGRTEPRGSPQRGAETNGSYGTFNATAYAAIAKRRRRQRAGEYRRFHSRRQEASGGWASTASRPATKPMSTRRRPRSRRSRQPGSRGRTPICGPASLYLADHQRADGAWESFAQPDPNSTSTATFAITAAGFDRHRRAGATSFGPDAPDSRTRRRWSGCGRSRTRASRRRPMRAASTARATRSVPARSRRASRSRRSGGDGYPVSPLEPQACP